MHIKYRLPICCLFFIGIIFLSFNSYSNAQSQKMHPKNKILNQMPNDTDQPYKWPMVPRVTALEAFKYYSSGKALLVNIGHDSPQLLGGLDFTEKQAWNLDVRKLHAYAGKRLIITY